MSTPQPQDEASPLPLALYAVVMTAMLMTLLGSAYEQRATQPTPSALTTVERTTAVDDCDAWRVKENGGYNAWLCNDTDRPVDYVIQVRTDQ